MSTNFLKVKRKMLQEIAETPMHTGKSWADIMLRAAGRCRSDEDQKDFMRFILNPDDSFDIPEPTFMDCDTTADVLIQKVQSMKIIDTEEEKECEVEIELQNEIVTNGGTTFIKVTPVKCTS